MYRKYDGNRQTGRIELSHFMPENFRIDKWIPETQRIVLASELRYCAIRDLGVYKDRFRLLFSDGRFVEFVPDKTTKSGLNIYRPYDKWKYHIKDFWRLKYKSPSELLILRNAAVRYLQIAAGDPQSFKAFHWLQHASGLEPHLFLTIREFVEIGQIRELLKIPDR